MNISSAMRTPGKAVLQRKCACGSKGSCPACRDKEKFGTLSRLERRDRASAAVPAVVHQVLQDAGQPLDAGTRGYMEPRFGHDFSEVRVHTGTRAAASADAVDAVAYTVGNHIVFSEGAFAPHTPRGRGVIAHELTHVIQQGSGAATLAPLSVDLDTGSAAEVEAHLVQHQIESGSAAVAVQHASTPAGVQRLPGSDAGGCGLCFGQARLVGIEAHKRIQQAFRRQNGSVMVESPVLAPSPGDDNGRLDLMASPRLGQMQIGEIKPANPAGLLQGDLDLMWYEEQLADLGVQTRRMILPPPVDPIPFPTLAPPDCPQFQQLFVDPPVNGIYTYWCMPDFSELIRECDCETGKRKRQRERVPNRVPETSPQRVPERRPSPQRLPEAGPTPIPAPPPQPAPQPQPQPQPSPGPQPAEPERPPGEVIPFPGRPPQTQPIPQAAKSPVDQIVEFVRNVIATGAAVEDAARQFLAQNPHLVDFLIGAAVTAIVATIIEDIATLGAGIADDPLIISICVQLIRVARAVKAATALAPAL